MPITAWMNLRFTTYGAPCARICPSLGIRSEVAERCLNHKLPGIRGVYNTHDYFAEREAALETWTVLLLEIAF